MSDKIPASYAAFQESYPAIFAAYEQLGAAVHGEGPLDDGTRALVKLALAIGVGAEGAVHSHTRQVSGGRTQRRGDSPGCAAGDPDRRFPGRHGCALVDQRHPWAGMSDLVTRTRLTCPECTYTEPLDIPPDT